MSNDVRLDVLDALELAELLEFLHDWTWFHTQRADESLQVFTCGDGYTLEDLRADLARFTFLLGGTGRGRVLHSEDPR